MASLQEKIRKLEGMFVSLTKSDPAQLSSAFQALRDAAKQGRISPEVYDTLRSSLFNDDMVANVGNKRAYADFLSRPQSGVHIRMDGNDFKHINDTYGHETGDSSIRAMGEAIRGAMDEAVGRDKAKVFHLTDNDATLHNHSSFRIGGDEFHAFVPDHESAAKFGRALRNRLEALAPFSGKLTMSMGFGHTPETADKALYQAKAAKRAHMAEHGIQPGHMLTRNFAHSLVPGFEGAVPVETDQLPLKAPGASENSYEAPKTVTGGATPPKTDTPPAAPAAPMAPRPRLPGVAIRSPRA